MFILAIGLGKYCCSYLSLILYMYVPVLGNLSCLQTTPAFTSSHAAPHTVPQRLLPQSTTSPLSPPSSLTSPVEQLFSMHLTQASSECPQFSCPIGLAGQSISLVSVPAQFTSSSQITPTPLEKPEVRTTAPMYPISVLNVSIMLRPQFDIDYTGNLALAQ